MSEWKRKRIDNRKFNWIQSKYSHDICKMCVCIEFNSFELKRWNKNKSIGGTYQTDPRHRHTQSWISGNKHKMHTRNTNLIRMKKKQEKKTARSSDHIQLESPKWFLSIMVTPYQYTQVNKQMCRKNPRPMLFRFGFLLLSLLFNSCYHDR